MKKEKAIVLVSGGLDSCVTAALATRNYETYFLHTNYKQLTAKREKKAFLDIANYYNVKKKMIVDINYLQQIGGSSLTDKDIKIYDETMDSIPNTYVPFRNANLLAIAVAWAEVVGARAIFIGAMEEDSAGYPDCREEFFEKYNQMIEPGTKPDTHIEVKTPIIHNTKSEVVKIGKELNTPFGLTWSCYQNSKKACGMCESCKLRINAFKKAGLKDEIPYKIDIDWNN